MNLLYKPFAWIASSVGRLLGKQAFRAVWTEVDDSPEPPAPTVGEVDIVKAVFGAAMRAALIAVFVTVLRRLSARAFHDLFGVWPGKSPPGAD
jgi:hypothetical protein